MSAIRVLNRPASNEILCVSVVRNEIRRLPDFLRHYRGLGIKRFLVIDHQSVDGTKEYLLDQPDVDLYTTSASYARSLCGEMWVAGLVRTLSPGRWILHADADELLVYDGCENHSLQELVTRLEAQGRRSLPAMMLDMYSVGAIRQSKLQPGDRMIDVCPMYDSVGYTVERAMTDRWILPRAIKYQGGPRQRLFSTFQSRFECDLAKTPLVRWDPDVTVIYAHVMHPFALNFGAPSACLLHFKLLSDFHERAVAAVKMSDQCPDSMAAVWLAECRQYLARVRSDPDLTAFYEGSRRYQHSGMLVENGLMSPMDWS